MIQKLTGDDFRGADSATLDFILQESDKRVEAQVALLTAADGRANGILAAAVTLAAAGVAIGADEASPPSDLFWVASTFSAVQIFAAASAMWSLWPTPVNPQGWYPSSLLEDVRLSKDLATIKREIAASLDRRLTENRDCGKRLSRRVKFAMLLLISAPVIATATSMILGSGSIRVLGCVLIVFTALTLFRLWPFRPET